MRYRITDELDRLGTTPWSTDWPVFVRLESNGLCYCGVAGCALEAIVLATGHGHPGVCARACLLGDGRRPFWMITPTTDDAEMEEPNNADWLRIHAAAGS